MNWHNVSLNSLPTTFNTSWFCSSNFGLKHIDHFDPRFKVVNVTFDKMLDGKAVVIQLLMCLLSVLMVKL